MSVKTKLTIIQKGLCVRCQVALTKSRRILCETCSIELKDIILSNNKENRMSKPKEKFVEYLCTTCDQRFVTSKFPQKGEGPGCDCDRFHIGMKVVGPHSKPHPAEIQRDLIRRRDVKKTVSYVTTDGVHHLTDKAAGLAQLFLDFEKWYDSSTFGRQGSARKMFGYIMKHRDAFEQVYKAHDKYID